jgi:hypothetical protein
MFAHIRFARFTAWFTFLIDKFKALCTLKRKGNTSSSFLKVKLLHFTDLLKYLIYIQAIASDIKGFLLALCKIENNGSKDFRENWKYQ